MMNENAGSQAVTLQLPSTSEPVTAATSVQTLLQEDEKQATSSNAHDGAGVEVQEEQGAAPGELEVTAQSTRISTPVPPTPQVYLTFLLVTGRRRTMSFEPETTIGRVKELVWNSWPSGVSRLLHTCRLYPDRFAYPVPSYHPKHPSPQIGKMNDRQHLRICVSSTSVECCRMTKL